MVSIKRNIDISRNIGKPLESLISRNTGKLWNQYRKCEISRNNDQSLKAQWCQLRKQFLDIHKILKLSIIRDYKTTQT